MSPTPSTDDLATTPHDESPGSPAREALGPSPEAAGEPSEDLNELLLERSRRQRPNRVTLALAAVALAVAGFAVGAVVQGDGDDAAAFPGGGPPAGFELPEGFEPPAGLGSAEAEPAGEDSTEAPAALTGTVRLVDGTTVYVESPDGSLTTVRTDAGTEVLAGSPAALDSLREGDSVVVATNGAGDEPTATSITKTNQETNG